MAEITKIQLKTKTSANSGDTSLDKIDLDLGEALVDAKQGEKKVIIGGVPHTATATNKANNDENIILGASKTQLGEVTDVTEGSKVVGQQIDIKHIDNVERSSYTLKTKGAKLSKIDNIIEVDANYTLTIQHDDANKNTAITLTPPQGSAISGTIDDPDWDTKVLNRPTVHWVGVDDSHASDVILSIDNEAFSYKFGKSTSDLHHYDVCIHKQKIGETTHYEYAIYIYDAVNTVWQKLNSEYDAKNVIMPNDIQLAGSYTEVGNIKKDSTSATGILECAGKSVYETLNQIFNQLENPTITDPSYTFSSAYKTNTGNDEIGSYITSVGGKYTFTDGTYPLGRLTEKGKYESNTSAGCSVTSYTTKVTNPDYISTISHDSNPSISTQYTDNQNNGIQIDSTTAKTYATLSHSLTWSASPYFPANSQHTEYFDDANKNNQKDEGEALNIKSPSPIPSSTLNIQITGVQRLFYGTSEEKISQFDSTKVRSFSNEAISSSFNVTIPVGAMQVVIAIPSSYSLQTVLDSNDSNSNIVNSFAETELNIAGANGYMGQDNKGFKYKIYYLNYASAVEEGKSNTYKVTIS